MKKQKICIIGGGLSGLITAITLSKLNCDIDLVVDNFQKNTKSDRTIAISENNFIFLKKQNISHKLRETVWPSHIMKLYSEVKNKKFSKIFELNNDEKNIVLYVTQNSKIMKLMMNKIKQIKSISIKRHNKIDTISSSGLLKSIKFNHNHNKYNLVILCVGNNSNIVRNFFDDKKIENSYNESAITTILNHKSLKNNIVRQIFFDKEILALLPISNKKTSIVWTIKKSVYKKNNSFLKRKIKLYAKNFLKDIKFEKKIEYYDVNALIRKKYYKDRVLLFGDALHKIHPFTGQGFNMILRDLINLEKTLKNKISLGLDIGSEDVLSEFSEVTKPRNLGYLITNDFIKGFFSIDNKNFKNLRNTIITNLNKNSIAKDFFRNVMSR
tara:strand:+ start:5172 stop:6320 length:1149 start_codon:yes stop_codon:yes gene_type:complete